MSENRGNYLMLFLMPSFSIYSIGLYSFRVLIETDIETHIETYIETYIGTYIGKF